MARKLHERRINGTVYAKDNDTIVTGDDSYIDTLVSGSPILQNGKIVGAVTHVLVNDPTRGYGIFIEDMLKQTP